MPSPDVFYYNLSIGNNDPITAGSLDYTEIPAEINANNNIPILQNPDDYYACIIRFQIPLKNVPLINFLIQTPVVDINKSIYSFCITQGNPTLPPTTTSGQQFVYFEPQNILPSIQIPPVGTPTQTFSNYYFLYDYAWFVKLLNKALLACSTALGLAHAPFFQYDANTQLISLYAPTAQFSDSLANPYYIWFNNPLLTFLNPLESVSYNQGPVSSVNGADNLIVIHDYTTLNEITLSGTQYLKMDFQYTSFGYWNFLKTIYVTTNMNTESEVIFMDSPNKTQNVDYVNILEDFMPDLAIPQGAGIQSQIFTYNAPSLYRIFTFNQKSNQIKS
jgi:hypothetical protein